MYRSRSHRPPFLLGPLPAARGLTLIEVLVALAMTLIVLGAMITAFQYASGEISKGRARIEMSNQLRVVQDLLRADLDGLTVDARPWAITSAAPGYLEYIEGPRRDDWRFGHVDNIVGDVDDILALTTRCDEKPFRGRLNDPLNPVIESNVAEVVWWTNYVDANANGEMDYNEPVSLYRRVLLIRPDLNPVPVANVQDVLQFFMLNDVSMRWDVANGLLIPNALGDLGRRENRFAHQPLDLTAAWPFGYPHLLNRAFLQDVQMTESNFAAVGLGGVNLQYLGQDVVASNLLAFDLKAFSINTPLRQIDDVVVGPTDPGFVPAGVAGNLDAGAWVDLNYAGVGFDLTLPQFATLPVPKWQVYLPAGYVDIVYDTFTTAYEADGIDQDNNGIIDQAVDGLDNDGTFGVDDEGERETAAPYPYRLPGLQVTIRVVEPTSRQVVEIGVVSNFLPK